MKAFRIQHSDDRVVQQLQEATKEVTDQFLDVPILDGRLIKDVELSSGDNTISHGLGRRLQGWFVVKADTSAATMDLYDKQASNNIESKTLVINNSSAGAVISLWVF